MKRNTPRSILRTLFVPYTLLFVIAFFIVMVFFIVIESNKIKNNSMKSIENNVISISESLDTAINSLDTVSQNIMYSNLIKEHFVTYLNYKADLSGIDHGLQDWNNIKNNKILYDLLIAMIGPNAPVDQVNLYSLTEGVFGAGLISATSSESVTDKDWYQTVTDFCGKKYVFLDVNPDLGRFFSYSNGEYFLSLSRLYYNSYNSPQGIVEVKKSFVEILNAINSIHYTYSEKVYLFNNEGELIYPLNKKANMPNYYDIIYDESEKPVIQDTSIMYKYLKSKRQHLLYNQSSYSGFSTIIVVDNIELIKPVFRYVLTIFLILLFICAATIIVSYMIARRISTPLNKLHLQLYDFQLTGDIGRSDLEEVNTNVTELNTLYQAFFKMQEKAKISMKNELLLQAREMQARMLALQVQMNPHFLYNSMSTIQAMADENMNEEIILMCQNISKILRYISSNDDQLVDLTEELNHTKDYMECMKIRYTDDLAYSISIPEEMFSCQIPKLCLQLIVENAIKFTTSTKAPWHIHIEGVMTSTHWELQIRDNGPGFSKDKLHELNEKIEEINKTGVLPNLEINGMGLLNIYIRFKILYKGSHIFRLSNHIPTGAIVTIGGKT